MSFDKQPHILSAECGYPYSVYEVHECVYVVGGVKLHLCFHLDFLPNKEKKK